MDRQPTLRGETLLLRPLVEADREGLFLVASDRELWALHPSHDRWQRPVFDALFDEALEAGIIDRPYEFVLHAENGLPNGSAKNATDGFRYLVDEGCIAVADAMGVSRITIYNYLNAVSPRAPEHG